MENLDIRLCVKDSGLLFKDVALRMKVTPEHLSRILRKPLSKDQRRRVLAAIEELKKHERGERLDKST